MPRGVYERTPKPTPPVLPRLTKRLVFDLRGCWVWTGCRTKGGEGYGQIVVARGKTQQVHRVVYEALVGPIPDGLQIDHLCSNKACCNPAHLEPVTARENQRREDQLLGIRSAVTHCPQGHEYTPENTGYKKSPPGKVWRECIACRRLRAWRRFHPEVAA